MCVPFLLSWHCYINYMMYRTRMLLGFMSIYHFPDPLYNPLLAHIIGHNHLNNNNTTNCSMTVIKLEFCNIRATCHPFFNDSICISLKMNYSLCLCIPLVVIRIVQHRLFSFLDIDVRMLKFLPAWPKTENEPATSRIKR